MKSVCRRIIGSGEAKPAGIHSSSQARMRAQGHSLGDQSAQRGSVWGLENHVNLPRRKKTGAAPHPCLCTSLHARGSQEIIMEVKVRMKSAAVIEVC